MSEIERIRLGMEIAGTFVASLAVLAMIFISGAVWPFAGFTIGVFWAVWMAGCRETATRTPGGQ